MQETEKVTVMIFSANTALALYGNVKLILEGIEKVKSPVCAFEVSIQKVEGALFPSNTVV
jgi:hypothetical protein